MVNNLPANLEVVGDRVFVHGPMTFQTVPTLYKTALKFAKLTPLPKTIDLADVTQADSSALALLLEWQAWAKGREHCFHLVNVPSPLYALGQVMGVDQILNLEEKAAARQE